MKNGIPAILALALLSNGCWNSGLMPNFSEDSWQHYMGGGHYPSEFPDMSSDGDLVIFSSPSSGQGDIYGMSSDGTRRIRLTTDPKFESEPIFSRDGKTIVFSRENAGQRHLWSMDRDGASERQLTFGDNLAEPQFFHPNGKELIFVSSPVNNLPGRFVKYYALNLENLETREVSGPLDFSKDGARMVCTTSNSTKDLSEVFVQDQVDNKVLLRVKGDHPRISPDGLSILFSTKKTDTAQLWSLAAVDGTSVRKLGEITDPMFTEDCRHIVYGSSDFGRELYYMNTSGEDRKKIDCPDGSTGRFKRCRGGFIFSLRTGTDRVGEIYVLDTATWKTRKVGAVESDKQ